MLADQTVYRYICKRQCLWSSLILFSVPKRFPPIDACTHVDLESEERWHFASIHAELDCDDHRFAVGSLKFSLRRHRSDASWFFRRNFFQSATPTVTVHSCFCSVHTSAVSSHFAAVAWCTCVQRRHVHQSSTTNAMFQNHRTTASKTCHSVSRCTIVC